MRVHRYSLLLILLLAAGTRLYYIRPQSIWFDEGWSAFAAVQPTLQAAVEADPTNPPLYYLLLNLSARGLGDSAFSLRVVSLLLGLLTIPLAYRLARQSFGPRAGYYAATLDRAFTAAVVGLAGSTHVYAAGCAGAAAGAGLAASDSPAAPLGLAHALAGRTGSALCSQHRACGRAVDQWRDSAGLAAPPEPQTAGLAAVDHRAGGGWPVVAALVEPLPEHQRGQQRCAERAAAFSADAGGSVAGLLDRPLGDGLARAGRLRAGDSDADSGGSADPLAAARAGSCCMSCY